MIVCDHCGASIHNLHRFQETAGIYGRFDVIRCLLCGWQISRLNPTRRRPLPDVDLLLVDEPDELEELESRFVKFASKSSNFVSALPRDAFWKNSQQAGF